jgi:hypothetical protein
MVGRDRPPASTTSPLRRAFTSPPVTAVDVFLEQFEGGDPRDVIDTLPEIDTPPELVVRRSTGPAPP